MTGLFITLEALDFAGKTTQLEKITTFIKNKYGMNNVVITREPGGTPTATRIREVILDTNLQIDPLTEAYLYAASRSSHVNQLILPSLKSDKLVISDRYLDSSLAYQGFARTLGIDFVKELNSHAIQGILPKYTIFLDGDPDTLSQRFTNSKRDKLDRIESEGIDFQLKCRQGFYKIIENNPDRFWVINASLAPNEVFDQIRTKLEPILDNFFHIN